MTNLVKVSKTEIVRGLINYPTNAVISGGYNVSMFFDGLDLINAFDYPADVTAEENEEGILDCLIPVEGIEYVD